MDKKEQARLRKQKQRDKERQNSVTSDSVTPTNVTQKETETVPASHVEGLHGVMYETLPERTRHLTLSDGQVLDRLNQAEGHTSGDFMQRIRFCNESSYNFKPNKGKHG